MPRKFKAAALGLMVLVALYFWGPLAWKWLSAAGNKRSTKVNMASLILTDDPIDPAQQSKTRGPGKFRWEKARQLIRQDPRMVTATFDPSWTDPFGEPAAAAAPQDSTAEGAESEVAAAVAAASEPATLGIALGSVMIGAHKRVATINGETCHEGETITVADRRDKSVTYRFRVVRIERQSVELDVGGRKLTLTLAQPKLANGDELEHGKPRDGD